MLKIRISLPLRLNLAEGSDSSRSLIEPIFLVTKSRKTASKINQYIYGINASILGISPLDNIVAALSEMKLDDKGNKEVSSG
jgi:hypothetical protein